MEKDAAVSTPLPLADRRRCHPFDVQLHIGAPLALRSQRARLRHHLEVSVLNLPLRLAVAALPLAQILAVKKDHGIARRTADFFLIAEFARLHNLRLRTKAVMNMPLCAGNNRSGLVAQRILRSLRRFLGGLFGRLVLREYGCGGDEGGENGDVFHCAVAVTATARRGNAFLAVQDPPPYPFQRS